MSRWFYLPLGCTAVLAAGFLFGPPWSTAQDTNSAATMLVDKGNVRSVVLAEGRLKPSNMVAIGAQVSEADINLVKRGQQAEIRLPGVAQTLLAQIEQVDPAPLSIVTDPQLSGNSTSRGRLETPAATYYRASLRIPNPDMMLRPYMTADVRVIVAEASDVLVVPLEYITREANGGSFVHVMRPGNGGFERRRIDLGIRMHSLPQTNGRHHIPPDGPHFHNAWLKKREIITGRAQPLPICKCRSCGRRHLEGSSGWMA